MSEPIPYYFQKPLFVKNFVCDFSAMFGPAHNVSDPYEGRKDPRKIKHDCQGPSVSSRDTQPQNLSSPKTKFVVLNFCRNAWSWSNENITASLNGWVSYPECQWMKCLQEEQRFRVIHWDHFGDQQLLHDETRTDRSWSTNWASARILVMNLSAVIAPWWGYVSKDDLPGWNLRSLPRIRLARCRFSVGRSSFIDFPEWFLCSRSEGRDHSDS